MAPMREVLVEECGVFFEELIEVGIFVGGKTVHEGNTKVEESVGIDVVEIVLVFGGGIEIADLFHGGVSWRDDFGLDGIDDRIFANHVAIKAVRDESDFVGVDEDELLKHHVVEDGRNVL